MIAFLFLLAQIGSAQLFGGNGPSGSGQYATKSCSFTRTALDCATVTSSLLFVGCNTTSNLCYCLPTFSGNASLVNKCGCAAPKSVYFPSSTLGTSDTSLSSWGFSNPVCLDVAYLQSLDVEAQRQAKHLAAVDEFFTNTIYPKPYQILATQGSTLTNILAPNVKSRISPAGEFNGYLGVVEYFYGFVASPGTIVTNVTYKAVSASGNVVGAKAQLSLVTQAAAAAATGNHPPPLWNLTVFCFFKFDSNDKISSIDVSVPNLGILLDITDPTMKMNLIYFTCQVMTMPSDISSNPNGTCGNLGTWGGGPPQQQFGTCVQFMNSIPYGSRNRMNSNTFICRNLHVMLTAYRPDVHCVHSGPTGGEACIDFTYESYYLDEY